MFVQRVLCCLACATSLAAQAELAPPKRGGYLGLQLAPSGMQLSCKPVHACERAMELGFVGGKPLGDSFALEGRIATHIAVMGVSPGVAVGAGLRWNFSRRGSMALGLNAYELPAAMGGYDTVRSATIGLQWRY
jgi:hypothetical protein